MTANIVTAIGVEASRRWFGRHRDLLLGIVVLSVLAFSQNVVAQEALGRAAKVDPQASATQQGLTIEVLDGADLYEGQTIVTGPAGQVQIVFMDDTRMVVGPNSQLLLETYLLRNDNSVASLTVDALSGTFRFITGNSDHEVYQVNTPSGTIGVRGTAFDLWVDALQELGIVWLLNGGVELCGEVGECIEIYERCGFGAIPQNTSAVEFTPDSGEFSFGYEQFPYEQSQHPLLQDFRVFGALTCAWQYRLGVEENEGPPQSLAPGIYSPVQEMQDEEEFEEDEEEGEGSEDCDDIDYYDECSY